MTRAAMPRLHCAIYTRVSTDAGLEQEWSCFRLMESGFVAIRPSFRTEPD
jgi:hypothetical protein